MQKPKLPPNEAERLKALQSYQVLDTVSEQEFDDITSIAANICDTPISVISLIDKDRQWFKSRCGIGATETPRDLAFCAHAINDPGNILLVEDASKDPRFAKNPLVVGAPGIRFYAGVPLVAPGGEALGTLCVIGVKPQALSEKQKTVLISLARQVMTQLELRKKNIQLAYHLKASEQLKSEYENIALAAEKTHSAVVVTNADGEIEYANNAFEKMTGFVLDDVIGKKPGSILQGPDTDPEHVNKMREGLSSRQSFTQEILNYSKNGKPYWLSCAIAPVFDPAGELTKFVAVEQDISKQKEIERALIKAKEEAIASERVKDQFLSNMSHEIRTPMNAIIGISNILLDQKDFSLKQLEMIQHVNGAAKHLLKIINDILDLSKVNSEKLTFEQINFDFRKVFKNIEYTLGLKAVEEGIALSVDLDPAIPTVLAGDPTRFNQILLNLLSNAIKFTDRGSVSVKAKLSELNKIGPRVNFEVIDTGIGMTPEEVEKIFDKFTQSNVTVNRQYGGTGLGLSIAKKLVEHYGGTIEVYSKKEEGSTFVFDLQFAYALENAVEKVESDFIDLSPMERAAVHILIAEDNKLNQIVASKQLQAFGFKVAVANNGQEAVSMLESDASFNLVLMDVNMPIMNGLDATRYIRKNLGEKSNIKISAMTASVLPKDIQICIESGMDDFISKPFEPNLLYRKIVSLIKESFAEAEQLADGVYDLQSTK